MTTAIIHHTHFTLNREPYAAIAVALGGELVGARCVTLRSSEPALSEHIVDAFLSLRRTSDGVPLCLFVSHPTVASLIEECDLPSVQVRRQISGTAFHETWEAASAGCASVRKAQEANMSQPGPLVVATDASKNSFLNQGVVGIGVATHTGTVWFDHVQATTVLEAEFAALARAIRSHAREEGLVLLTDSLRATQILRGDRPGTTGRWEKETRQELARAQERGYDVQVHWVRGHDGHVLNEIADRAARCGRRVAEWELDEECQRDYRQRLRQDLAQGLADLDILALHQELCLAA